MVNVSRETPGATQARLRHVLAQADLEVLEGAWSFHESALQSPPALTPAVLAVVRDDVSWSALAPETNTGSRRERFGVWSFHFPAGVDNSGFVGWLATELKQRLGTGVFVVCGSNTNRGGIYDYWGCPIALLPDAVTAMENLAGHPRGPEPRGGQTSDKENKVSNYEVTQIGALDQWRDHFGGFDPARSREGRRVIDHELRMQFIGLTANSLEPGEQAGYWHAHSRAEELYVFLEGRGQMGLDDNVVDVAAGSVVRVGQDVWRTWRAHPDSPGELRWLCIRAGGESLTHLPEDSTRDQERPPPWQKTPAS